MSTRYGHVFYMRHKGQGPCIIFIHGLASSTHTWTKLLEYLPDNLDVYLIDMLGHGKSDAPYIKYTVNMQLEILDGLIHVNHLQHFYLFGHSYGGWVVAKYAETSETKGIIIEDSGGLESFYNEIRGTKSREDYKEQMLDKSSMFGGKRHVISSIADDEFREGQLNESNLKSIKAPTLVIWGTDDAIIDIKYSNVFLNSIKGSELKEVKGARHTPHYTNPEEVSRYLIEFIGRSGT